MIIDGQTNFVYLADTLSTKYPAFAKEFISKLDQAKIQYGFLPNTKDVWAVDYMPIQVAENRFVRFTYRPDYLVSTKKWSKTISDVDTICDAIGLQPTKSNIILDGGNISKWNDKVLMTTKVFIENKDIPELQLIEQLKNLLEVNQLIFVPIEKGDWLGHADGTARFISNDTVLINDYSKEVPENYVDLLGALNNSGLKWLTFPFDTYKNEDINDAAGLYLNYLELERHLFLPIFGKERDDEAIERSKKIFPAKEVIAVRSKEPAKDTGIINCLTWNIFKKT